MPVPRIWSTTLFYLFLATSAAAFAAPQTGKSPSNEKEEKSYEIEVVVFENILPGLADEEQWVSLNQPVIAGLEDAMEPGDAPATPSSPPGASLAAAVAALGRDPNYRILAHKLWAQTAEAQKDAKSIRIRSKRAGELDGVIKFYVSRFLHLEVDLLFRGENTTNLTSTANPSVTVAAPGNEQLYEISETRRVKSKEIHYFDHPKFGLVVRITPQSN
jgi:hypothetical protein